MKIHVAIVAVLEILVWHLLSNYAFTGRCCRAPPDIVLLFLFFFSKNQISSNIILHIYSDHQYLIIDYPSIATRYCHAFPPLLLRIPNIFKYHPAYLFLSLNILSFNIQAEPLDIVLLFLFFFLKYQISLNVKYSYMSIPKCHTAYPLFNFSYRISLNLKFHVTFSLG